MGARIKWKIADDNPHEEKSNAFLKEEMLDDSEPFYPLCVYVCDLE